MYLPPIFLLQWILCARISFPSSASVLGCLTRRNGVLSLGFRYGDGALSVSPLGIFAHLVSFSQVFTTLALLNITQFTMGKFLYLAVQSTSESWVSIKRMETILLMEVS